MVSSFQYLFNISVILMIHNSYALDILKKRNFKPVEGFLDLVSYDHHKPIVSSGERPSPEFLSLNEPVSKNPDVKYILQWTSTKHMPFLTMGLGQQGFIVKNCLYTNCYVTSMRGLFEDITKFDAILFNGPDVKDLPKFMLPQQRSPHQKYVFVSTQPSDAIPVLLEHFDNFFNWTWTYKLNSDLVWGSFVVAHANMTIAGPNTSVNWIPRDKMKPVKKELKAILDGKKKAVAWFPSKCQTLSKRENMVKELNRVLKYKYGLAVDIYGDCGDFKCPPKEDDDDNDDCYEVIRTDYFFYLAYEEVLSADYVAELLPAVKYNAVPIVYGGADYKRFLSEGSYLNAREMSVYVLAAKINELIFKPDEYSEYFKWTNHYEYFSSTDHEDTDEQCKMCALLNDENKFNERTMYSNFRNWWSPVQYQDMIWKSKAQKLLRHWKVKSKQIKPITQ